MGTELADGREWSEQRGLDWDLRRDPAHAGVARLVGDLNRAYRSNPALWSQDTTPDGFRWIVGDDSYHNTFAFERTATDGSVLVCVVNFAAVPQENYRIGMPCGGTWREVLNTDADTYGGSGVGNLGTVHTEEVPWHGRPASAALRVPPLGALWLRPGV
jgi:1,4-alpha-glucan branching enzyme